jgi:hypothetical protein
MRLGSRLKERIVYNFSTASFSSRTNVQRLPLESTDGEESRNRVDSDETNMQQKFKSMFGFM